MVRGKEGGAEKVLSGTHRRYLSASTSLNAASQAQQEYGLQSAVVVEDAMIPKRTQQQFEAHAVSTDKTSNETLRGVLSGVKEWKEHPETPSDDATLQESRHRMRLRLLKVAWDKKQLSRDLSTKLESWHSDVQGKSRQEISTAFWINRSQELAKMLAISQQSQLRPLSKPANSTHGT